MTNTFDKKQGDINDSIVVTLSGVESLVGATFRALIELQSGARTKAILAATLTNVDTRELTVACGADGGWLKTAAPGKWAMEYEGTMADAVTVLTWPSKGYDIINVSVDLDA